MQTNLVGRAVAFSFYIGNQKHEIIDHARIDAVYQVSGHCMLAVHDMHGKTYEVAWKDCTLSAQV